VVVIYYPYLTEEEGLRDKPVQQKTAAGKRNGVSIWQLQKICAFLLPAWVAHAEGFASVGIGAPFVGEEHAGVDTVVDEIDEAYEELRSVGDKNGLDDGRAAKVNDAAGVKFFEAGADNITERVGDALTADHHEDGQGDEGQNGTAL
jgi:hypothetical protein